MFNGVEVVFHKAKHYYKKLKLQKIMQGEDVKMDVLVRRAFRMVNAVNLHNYIRHYHGDMFCS